MRNISGSKHSILDDSLFLGIVTGIQQSSATIYVPNQKNTEHFISKQTNFNESVANQYLLIHSRNRLFLAKSYKEEIREKEFRTLSESLLHPEQIHPNLYADLITELDFSTLIPLNQLISLPAVGAKVYSADPQVVSAYLNNIEMTDKASLKQTQDFATLSETGNSFNMSFDSLFQLHAAIVGNTGSGKSNTAARLIEELNKAGKPCVIVDPTGEYQSLTVKETTLTIGEDTFIAPGKLDDTDFVNIFLPSPKSQLPKMLEAIRDLKAVYAYLDENLADDTDPEMKRFFIDDRYLVRQNQLKYEKDGVDQLAKYVESQQLDDQSFKLENLPKQIEYECFYLTDFTSNLKYGKRDETTYGYCVSLISRIHRYVRNPIFRKAFQVAGSFNKGSDLITQLRKFCEQPDGILRIDFSNLQQFGHLHEVVVDIVARELSRAAQKGTFDQTKNKGASPMLLIIDEAHRFLQKSQTNDYDIFPLLGVEEIAREGRKNGLFLTLVTQSPKDLPPIILGQIGTFIVHRLSNTADKETIKAALPVNSRYDATFQRLHPGEAVVSSVFLSSPVDVIISRPDAPIRSETPSYLDSHKEQ